MANFTPQQIEEFLREFFDVVGARQYIGARYVPIFGRRGESSIEWDDTAPYEPLTVVTHQGDSYTSRQYVPAGVDILNAEYWAQTGAFNSQVEAYRAEVLALRDDWTTYQTDTDAAIQQWETDAENEIKLALGKTELLTFGDSFGNETTEWGYMMGKRLGLTPHVYNISGASWPLPNQVNNALVDFDTPEKRATVKMAIAWAGVNNAASGVMEDATHIKTFMTEYLTAFPQSTLYIAPMNVPNPYFTNYPNTYRNAQLSYPNLVQDLQNYQNRFILMKGCMFFNTGAEDLWVGDKLHPSTKGSYTIANNMSAFINGTYDVHFAVKPLGDLPAGVTMMQRPFITEDGLQLPELYIDLTTIDTSQVLNIYFRGCGIYIEPQLNYVDSAIVYTSGTSEIIQPLANAVYVASHPTNDNFMVRILTNLLPTDHAYHTLKIIPKIVPYGIKPLAT